jgi:hypothetical protein
MTAALIGALTVISISIAAQERRAVPRVPADMLEGQRLVDKESGVSILAPDNWVWVWLRQDEAGVRNFSASDPAGGLGFAVNVSRTEFEWTRKNAEDFQVGMAKKLMATRFDVNRLVFESSAVPVSNSYRFVWAIVLPNKERRFRFGYLAHRANRIVSFTCIGPNEREPENLLGSFDPQDCSSRRPISRVVFFVRRALLRRCNYSRSRPRLTRFPL